MERRCLKTSLRFVEPLKVRNFVACLNKDLLLYLIREVYWPSYKLHFMTKDDVLIGKLVSYFLFIAGAIFLLVASSILFFYDAKENEVLTLTEGTVTVKEGNEGYRVYTEHSNCEEVEVDIYYESFFNKGDLVWDPTCAGDLSEFSSATSGDWYYVGTLTFKATYNPDGNEVKVDFNVSASHEVMFTDREPIEEGLDYRQISFALFGLGGIIFAVTKAYDSQKKMEEGQAAGPFQTQINSANNPAAIEALASLKNHVASNNISHAELFTSFDLNNDGTIDHFELMNGLKSLGIDGLSPIDIESLVSILDINGDGKINLQELGLELDQNS